MLRPADHVLCLLVLAPLTGQQGSAAEPAPDPVAMVGRAEKSFGGGSKEEGVLLSWRPLDAIAALEAPATIELRAFRIVP